MPAFDASTPTISLSILEHPLVGPAPFAPGHVLTDPEAKQLNRWTVTAVANGVPAAIKRLQKEDPTLTFDAAAIQALFNSRYAEYELGQSNRGGTGSTPTDPLSKFVRAMAVEYVNGRLRLKGKNIQTVRKAHDADGNSVYEALLAAATERNPQWTELAKMQVDAISEASEDDFDIGDIGDKSADEPETVAEAAE